MRNKGTRFLAEFVNKGLKNVNFVQFKVVSRLFRFKIGPEWVAKRAAGRSRPLGAGRRARAEEVRPTGRTDGASRSPLAAGPSGLQNARRGGSSRSELGAERAASPTDRRGAASERAAERSEPPGVGRGAKGLGQGQKVLPDHAHKHTVGEDRARAAARQTYGRAAGEATAAPLIFMLS
jgi:hypothetical protein